MSILSLLLATSIALAPTATPVPKTAAPANSPTSTNDAVAVMARVLGIAVDPSRVGKPFRIDALAENVSERAWFRLLDVYMIDIGNHRSAFMNRNGKVRLHLAIDPGYHYVVQCQVGSLEGRKTRLESDWMN